METDLILGLALAGTTLGLVEGIKPGPLLTMVIKETLSGGLRAGIWTAAAPIFTDGPSDCQFIRSCMVCYTTFGLVYNISFRGLFPSQDGN